MSTNVRNVLSVAAATGKIGYVFLIDGEPYDWGVSPKASRSPKLTHQHVTEWIDYYQPQLLVTERVGPQSRKKDVTRALVNTIWKAGQDAEIKWACVDRIQKYQNKYVEAEALAVRFPELTAWLPKTRRLWESEPRRIIIFEALSMALSVVDKN